MNIEIKLTINNMKQNKKRTAFTIISIILCTMLIFITMLLISSIKTGIAQNIEKEYNDYHFIIKDISANILSKIKDKEYIDKIYIEENNSNKLQKLDKLDNFTSANKNINIYIKYVNVKKVCSYSNDIIYTLGLLDNANKKCEFNQKLLTAYGLIDVQITNNKDDIPTCITRVNYSYVIDIIIIVVLAVFSMLFIIVLYNAFLITINERKKEYAILNSIGGTEGQILKMIFLEGIIMGIIGIIIGGISSIMVSNMILELLNNILSNAGYNFKLIFDIKYIILSIFIIIFNIFISSIIPSVKASTTSVIEGIKNNKQIKYKKKRTLLEKIVPIEGNLAIKNIKRNKNKYRVITILLVVCMTSYIAVSTYINYEKESADIVNKYDVDAEIHLDSMQDLDYKSIFNNYEVEYGDKIEYMSYKNLRADVLVEPDSAINTDNAVFSLMDNKKCIQTQIIGLDDKTYDKYIKKINANYGDIIIYNNIMTGNTENDNENMTYSYELALKNEDEFKLSIIAMGLIPENNKWNYTIVDDKNLNKNYVLTDEIIDGYKEVKTKYYMPIIFINMNTFDNIEKDLSNYSKYEPNGDVHNEEYFLHTTSESYIKIKCKNIIKFSNYIENINKNQKSPIDIEYYTIKNQEKIIYINIVELVLRVIITAIITIGVISTINIINASLCEREQEFKTLHSLGATKGNINKILMYESIYMFIRATIISIILSIPILIGIIKYMQNIITLNKLLIPFGNITLFFTIMLLISIIITLFSRKSIKQ